MLHWACASLCGMPWSGYTLLGQSLKWCFLRVAYQWFWLYMLIVLLSYWSLSLVEAKFADSSNGLIFPWESVSGLWWLCSESAQLPVSSPHSHNLHDISCSYLNDLLKVLLQTGFPSFRLRFWSLCHFNFIFHLFVLFCFWVRVSCNSGWSSACYTMEGGFQFISLFLIYFAACISLMRGL